MHKTDAGERRKALKRKARKLAKDAKTVMKAAKFLPEAGHKARELQSEAKHALAESEKLKTQARLEDLHLWRMEKVKTTKKESKKYDYWMATWRESGRVRNVHLGSCAKMDAKTALQRARKMKAEALKPES
jgi:hypothetical protein